MLDSFSLFDTSLKLKNISLKPQTKTINEIPIELLNGSVYDINIEGSIFDKKVNIDLSSITLSIYVANIDSLLYSYAKPKQITFDPCKKFSFQQNQINSLYKIISQLAIVSVNISNCVINLYTKIEDVLIHFTIDIGKISMNTVNNDVESISTLKSFIDDLSVTVDFILIKKDDSNKNIYDIIAKGNEVDYNVCNVVEKISMNCVIKASKYRFDREEAMTTKGNDDNYEAYKEFENFEKNNNIDITLKTFSLCASDTLITNAMLLMNKIKKEKMKKRALLLSGKEKMRRIVQTLNKYNNVNKAKGFKFKTPSDENCFIYLQIIKYLTYISLVMKQKKYINFDLNFYSCQKLVTEYKNHIIKEDHFILDYLINENIGEFLKSPPIAGGNSIFLNMDIFRALRAPTQNNTLKAFMLFILTKFIYCKKCIENYKAYDDFYYLNIKAENIELKLTRNIKVNFDANGTNEEDLYVNDLEKGVRCARAKFLNEASKEASNVLLRLSASRSDVKLYSNLKEHFLLKLKILSIALYDVTYRDGKISDLNVIDDVEEDNVIAPLVKIEYETDVEMLIIDNEKCKINISIPNIVIIVDPFCVYFCILYFNDILHRYNRLNTTINEKSDLPVKVNEELPNSSFILQFDMFNIMINHIVIYFAHTSISRAKLEESIAFQISKINIKTDITLVSLNIDEILLGSSSNENFIDFLSYTKSLTFKTNIVNIFDIEHKTEFNDLRNNKIHIPLSNIMVEINKKDIDNLYKFYTEVITILKFIPKFNISNKEKINYVLNGGISQSLVLNLKTFVEKNENCDEELSIYSKLIKFITFSVAKITTHINFPHKIKNSDNNDFKHAILVINNVNIAVSQTESMTNGILVHFDSINVFHKHLTSLKIMDISSKKKINYNTIDDYVLIVNSIIKKEKNSDTNYDCYCLFLSSEKTTSIYSSLPKVNINIDYVFIEHIKSFLKFESNEVINAFFTCINEEYFTIIGNYSEKYITSDEEKIKREEMTIKKKINTKIDINAIELECLSNRNKFVTLFLNNAYIAIENDTININTEIKSIVDNRAISQKKRIILTKKSFATSKDTLLKFSFIMNLRERNIEISIDNARLVFLMRVVMDLVEYFYKIIFVDIIYERNYDAVYDKAKSLQDRINIAIDNMNNKVEDDNNVNVGKEIAKLLNSGKKNSFLQSQRKSQIVPQIAIKNILLNAINKSTNKSNMNSTSTFSKKNSNAININRRNRLNTIFPTTSSVININHLKFDERDKPKISLSLFIRNSEIAIAMNSLKEEEMLLVLSEVQFHKNIDKNKEEFLVDYFNKEKSHTLVKQNRSFEFDKIDYYVTIKDARIKKIIERNSNNNNVKSIEVCSFTSSSYNSKNVISNVKQLVDNLKEEKSKDNINDSIVVLFQNVSYEDVLSTMRIAAIASYMKIKMYTDVYEELLRLVFENLAEARTIVSKGTMRSREFYSNLKFDMDIEHYRKYLISQDIIFINRESTVNVYYYPSKCSNHKLDKKVPKVHIDDSEMKCEFGSSHPNIELDKMCEMKCKNLYLLMRFYINTHKEIYTSLTDMKVELNKNMTAFRKYTSMDLIYIKDDDALSQQCMEFLLTSGKGIETLYDITLNRMVINYYPLPLTVLNRFFSKYFFYYKNTKIKNILHDGPAPMKTVLTYLKDTEINIRSLLSENNNGIPHEIKICADIIVKMNTLGNTVIGPFKSVNEYDIKVKSGFLNAGIDSNNSNNTQSQFLDRFNLNVKSVSKCQHKWQDTNRYSYMFIKYKSDEEIKKKEKIENANDVDVVNDDPGEYRDFIRKFKFKESEEILNNNYIDILETKASIENDNNDNINEESMILSAKKENCSEAATNLIKEDNDIIRVSLNISQIMIISKIFTDVNADYAENAKLLLHSLTITTNFSKIPYKVHYGVYISKIDIRLCDSQFNAQLFQFIIDKLMVSNSNDVDDDFVNLAIKKLMKKYTYNNTDPIPTENSNQNSNSAKSQKEKFIADSYVKFIFRSNYHNSNQSKKQQRQYRHSTFNNLNLLTENNVNPFNANSNIIMNEKSDVNFWEPFIEPLPLKYTCLKSEENQYMKIEILSLKQTYDGIRRICRQRKFHSLNVNFNERLMESLNSVMKDYERTKEIANKEEVVTTMSNRKTLTVMNLTEYEMTIEHNDYFEELNEESNNDIIVNTSSVNYNEDDNVFQKKFHFLYKTRKRINDKDEIRVVFYHDNSSNAVNSSLNNDLVSNSKKIYSTYNIERPSKFFYIQTISRKSSEISSREAREELKKNFDNKASILLKGEHFLVCEIEINREGNKKLVTFRSNEGIKNELDFAVCIKFVLKDKMNKNDLTIVLKPGKYFYIPPIYLDNIKEIQFKPAMGGSSLIKFGTDSYPYNDTSFRRAALSSTEDKIYIAKCPIKEVRAYNDKNENVPYNDNIIFGIAKKFHPVENEFLDDKIKEKIEFIKSYQKYNNSSINDIDVSTLIADVTYVLTPIMKFYNSLPRAIDISKALPSDYNHKKVVGKPEMIKKFFDVENYFKREREIYTSDLDKKHNQCRQETYVDIDDCNYENFKIQKKKNKNEFNYEKSTRVNTGDYMSIYEPFILTEKGQNYLHFNIEVINNDNIINDNNTNSNLPVVNDVIIQPKSILTFTLKPFFFAAIIKSIKTSDNDDNNTISFPKIIKNNSQTIKCITSRNYFVNTIEINENHTLNSFFYCPFLFLNCSDMNVDIKFKDTRKRLLCKNSIKNIRLNASNEIDIESDVDINRVVMFNPSSKNHFVFELGNVALDIDEEEKNEDNESDIKHTSHSNNNNGDKSEHGMINVENVIYTENDANEEKNKNKIENKAIVLHSQWKKIQILDISKFGGITVDLTSKKTAKNMYQMQKQINKENTTMNDLLAHTVSTHKTKRKITVPVEESDQRLTFSLQMKLLPKYSTLIFITASIYIVNHTQKDIYVYHLPSSKNLPIKSSVLKAMTNSKFHNLIDYYPYVQLSFEDKYVAHDKTNFSGLINFSLEELKNKEFFVSLGDPRKEPLLCCKIYEEKGFKFVLITQKEDVNEYPYVIINRLNMPISFKQKENIDDKTNSIISIYNKLDKDMGIRRKITSHLLKEYVEVNNMNNATMMMLTHKNNITANISLSKGNIKNDNNNDITTVLNNDNKMYYTWEEPILYDKEKNTNILEIKLFGAKFEIDPQEIQKDDTFESRVETSDINYIDNIIDFSVSKGKIRILNKQYEYTYELYKHALVLKSTEEGNEPIIFEFHDPNLICERKYNGNFTMKSGMKEYEMFCVSIDETNDLVEKMNVFFKKAKDFANEFVIKKYAKNKCIYVEITQKKNLKIDIIQNMQTHLFLVIENIGISFIMQHNEFMYIWLKSIYAYIEKEYETDNSVLYKQIILKIKDYQIDNYAKRLYYPVVLSPLSDKSYDDNYKDFFNFTLVVNNFQMTSDLYQVELIYANFTPIDLRFENKFLENINLFMNKVRVCFDNRAQRKIKALKDYVNEIDQLKFIECNNLITSETRIHVKQFCIDDIKICFSLKFDNIDLFLETSSFLFLKPLIEELGLRILNLDSCIFSFPNYTKINIYQSTNDFTKTIFSFLFQQFISELIKALGGISSITSMQIVENLNNNILSNMKVQTNSLDKYRTKKGLKDIYRSGYENVSTVVGGFFMLAYKMMATVGRILAMLTLDEKYKKRRSYVINKSVKSLCSGLTLSSQLLLLAFFYMFAQFYYIPKSYNKTFHWTLVLLISIVIIIIGLFWKPVCGLFDMLTKGMETIGASINDIMADRVKIYARFPRTIKDNNLREYNSADALASFAKDCIDRAHDKAKTEDICIAVPGTYNHKRVIVLLTLERLMLVEYRGEFRFKEVLLLHFSSLDVYDSNDVVEKEKKYDMVWFRKGTEGRKIEISLRRKGCFSFYGREIEVTLYRLNEDNYVSKRYDNFINKIIENKNEVKEKFQK